VNLARNEKGVVLLFVLLLSVVALITTAGLLHMLARSGFVSGQQKRYSTALEAGKGGVETILQVVADRGAATVPLVNLVLGADLDTKLAKPTGSWGGADTSSGINPTVVSSYDMRFDLGTYRIYTKIIDTVGGNSGTDTGLLKTGVVNAGSGEITVMSIPYLYTIEELTENPVNASERVKLSVLYQY
jgi:hypothetical protein